MLKAIVKIIMITSLLWTLISVSVYATSIDGSDIDTQVTFEDYLAQLGVTPKEIGYQVPRLVYSIHEMEFDNYANYLESTPTTENYNSIGDFELSSGFDNHEVTTFTCEKNLIGQGVEDSLISVVVYTVKEITSFEEVKDFGEFVEEVEVELTYNLVSSSSVRLGASGLYNEVVSFASNTVQYVTILVENEYSVEHKTYKVTTIEEEKKTILENIEINFIEEEPLLEVPVIESFIDMFGLNQEIEF